MAKSKIDKDDIKRLVENTSNPTSTTSVYSAKYVDDNYATSTDVQTAVASVFKLKGNIADKTALLALTNVKQGDVYNAQSAFTLINGQNVQNVKAGDNIVCLSDAATSVDANWDNLCGNIDYDDLGDMPVATDTKVGGIMIGYIEGLDANFLKGKEPSDFAAVDHGHSDLHSHDNKDILDDITAAFTTELETSYDGAVNNSHTHDNLDALDNVSGVNTGDEDTTTIGSLINEATAKTTPVDADMVGLMDSDIAASNVMKKLSWVNIKATLKAYFDTLYTILGFYSVKVGSTYITAASNQDTIEFVAGTNVLLTPDADEKKLTIASTYRAIKVNNSQYISSGAINFLGIDGVQITPYLVGTGAQELRLDFSTDPNVLISFLGALPVFDLWTSGMGVFFLGYGNTYYNTPNPVCGTDTQSQKIEGFLTHYKDGNFNSFTFHDIRTNKMYISSSFWNGEDKIQIDWKRLITCTDLSEAEEIDAEFASGKWEIVLFGESSSATIENYNKEDEIYINISAYEDYVANLYNQTPAHLGVFTFTHNLKFIAATPDPPQIQFIANGIVIATAPAYTDPNTIPNDINLIEFTFKMFYSPSQSAVTTTVSNTIY